MCAGVDVACSYLQVRAVNLRSCDIKYSNSKEISAYVAKTTSLHSLCLRDNEIDAQARITVRSSILLSSRITFNADRMQAAEHFANAISVNPSITSLDLRNNRIGPSGG